MSFNRLVSLSLACLLSACTSGMRDGQRQQSAAAVDRIYVIDCGENHAKDLSAWTTTADKGKAFVFSNHCYLIRHRSDWLLWDSGNADRIATMPSGLVNPRGTLTAFMRKPLAESLREIGVAPEDIGYFAMSHAHGDHSGNANMFYRSRSTTRYMASSRRSLASRPRISRNCKGRESSS